MQLWEADLELGRQIRNENCGPELSPAHPVVGLMNLLEREILSSFMRPNGVILQVARLARQ
jgi:hypothetical protein